MSIPPITQNFVRLEFKTENDARQIFNSPLRPIKHFLLGPYRTMMGIWTLVNKTILYPNIPLIEQAPRIQGYFEKAAYLCGLNPAYPYIREFHLPDSLLSLETVKVPYTNYNIRLPQWPVLTFHVQTIPAINKSVLQSHRYEDFDGGPKSAEGVFSLLKAVFPETGFERDDFLLTCKKTFTAKAHQQIMKALNGKKLDQIIEFEGKKLIERWQNYSEQDTAFDLSAEMRYFTSAVITQAIFENSDNYIKLSDTVHYMNGYLFNQTIGQVKKGDKELFEKACKTFNEITNKILDSEIVNSLPLFQKDDQTDLTKAQKQALCLLLYFAGQETSAFALTHNFAKFALDPQKQKSIFEAIEQGKENGISVMNVTELKKFINEQLLKIPPVDALSRRNKTDTYLSFNISDKQEVGKFMRYHERILVNFSGTAKQLIANADNPSYNEASIFGGGANQCIGRTLAIKELFQLPDIILSQFILITEESEFKYTSKVTNQAETFMIKVEPRK